MAYSGLPSKGCANCRIRRIKCNQLKPACSQCQRAGMVCPGYRDVLSLIFRDENAKVMRKVHAQTHVTDGKRSHVGKKSLRIQSEGTPNGMVSALSPLSSLVPGSVSSDVSLRRLSSPMEYQAIHFFFHHYLSSSLSAPRISLDVSVWPFWQEISENKHLLDAVSSVGLAGLANVQKSPSMMQIARTKYASTLQRVMAAVRNLDQVDVANTIRAMMTLALFEMVDCGLETAASWKAHICGMIALVSFGKSNKLDQIVDIRMKVQFCFSIFINCIESGDRVPDAVVIWSCLWKKSLSKQDTPAATLAAIVIRCAELHASIKSGDLRIPSAVLPQVLQLDADLEEWRVNLPSSWCYTSEISIDNPEKTFNGRYHIYRDLWFQRIWDHYRWVRIFVLELILTTSSQLPSSIALCPQQASSLAAISSLAADICTSVASFLYNLAPQPLNIHTSTPRVGGVFNMLWTLRTAGGAIGVDETLYTWAVHMLEKIGCTMGIMRTQITPAKMKTHRKVWKDWLAAGGLGSPVFEEDYMEGWTQDVEALSEFMDLD